MTEKNANRPSAGGCRVFSEKTMWNHDPRTCFFSGVTTCLKCGAVLATPPPMRAGRID
jgi:hypothetical protein